MSSTPLRVTDKPGSLRGLPALRLALALLCHLLLVLPSASWADGGGLVAPINRSSPADTYQSFLAATAEVEALYADYATDKTAAKVHQLRRSMQRVRQLMDLDALPPSTRAKVGNAAIGYLYDILARLPPLDAATIPGGGAGIPNAGGAPALPSSWTIPGTDLRIAYVEDGANGGGYVFTADSIENLPEYYREIASDPVLSPRLYDSFHERQIGATGTLIPERFVSGLPDSLKRAYFDTPAWKIVAIIGITLLFLVLSILWTKLAWHRAARSGPLARIGWRLTVPAMLLLLLSTGEWLVAAELNPAGTFAAGELIVVTILRYAASAWLAWALVHFVIEAFLGLPRATTERSDANLLRLAGRVAALAASATILAYGADALGIPALGLIAGLGVSGIAFAIASQSTLENLFGGVSLFADRPFRIGDTIGIDGQAAQVERIGPRSSRLRTRDGTLCTVPNADLAKTHIVNFSLRDTCFLDQQLAVSGRSDPHRIRQLLQEGRALLETRDLIEKAPGWPRLHVTDTAPGRINLRVQARILTNEYHVFLAEQDLIILSVLSLMHDLGLELATYPFVATEPPAR